MYKVSQMTWHSRKFDENATLSFTISNKQFLKNYNKIWEKMENLMRINFKSKPVYGDDDKYMKTKITKYDGSIITNVHKRFSQIFLKKKHHTSVYQ